MCVATSTPELVIVGSGGLAKLDVWALANGYTKYYKNSPQSEGCFMSDVGVIRLLF